MAQSPTGIIPEELIDPAKLREVVEWLRFAPATFLMKKQLLRGWANTTGVIPKASDYGALNGTGIDQ